MQKPPKIVTASIGMEAHTLETRITARGHRFGCDEAPPHYDSKDAFPDPFDYIMAGLASCTLISIRLSAEHKKIPLEKAEVAIAFQRCPPKTEGGQADHITRTITLHGNLSEEDRLKLERSANCSAYKNISNGIPVTTKMG